MCVCARARVRACHMMQSQLRDADADADADTDAEVRAHVRAHTLRFSKQSIAFKSSGKIDRDRDRDRNRPATRHIHAAIHRRLC